MPTITKQITKGASYYGQTTAVGNLETVRKCGFLQCGSGDDHTLTQKERKLVENHDPNNGDLKLPPGPLNTRTPKKKQLKTK